MVEPTSLVPSPPLLSVQHLSVVFRTRQGTVTAVKDVSFNLRKGQTIGIVGESGSGKSVTSYALMGILDRAGRVAAGSIQFQGLQIDGASESLMKSLRGREISMVFQNPRAALNPIRRIGDQIADVLVEHAQATRAGARARVVELLRKVRIREPEERVDAVKRRRLARLAEALAHRRGFRGRMFQFDVVAVRELGGRTEISHWPHAFDASGR